MADTLLLSVFGLLVFCFGGAEAESYCYTYQGFYRQIIYCPDECCGSSHNRYCCSSDTGLIVGLVFAGIAFICVLVALICCCIKKKGKTGRVVGPGPTAFARSNVTVIHTGANGQPMAPPPQPYMYLPNTAPMQPPPPYKTFAEQTPPPAYQYADPAYPPPPTSGLPLAPPTAGGSTGPIAGPSQPPSSTSWGPSQPQPPPPPGFNVGQRQG